MIFATRTWAALGTLVVVGVAAFLVTSHKDPHEHVDGASTGSPYPTIARDAIDVLEIAEPGKPRIVLQKGAAGWTMVEPVADQADQQAVAAALDAIVGLKLRDAIAENPASYDKVGVKDADVVTVIPRSGGKDLVKLLVGKQANVRIGTDPRVWSTQDFRRVALVKDTKLWRDRSVAAMEPERLVEVRVEYPDGTRVVMEKEAPASAPASQPTSQPAAKKPDRWKLTAGADKVGGALDDRVAAQVATLGKIEADDFADPGAGAAVTGLDTPRAIVTLMSTEGDLIVLRIGKDDGEDTFVMEHGARHVWRLHKLDTDKVPLTPAQWRDRTIVKLDPEEIVKAELVVGGERTVLERADKLWKPTFPADLGDIDPSRAQAVVRTLATLRGARLIENPDLKTLGFDKPAATATFWKKDGRAVKLLVGGKDRNDVAVMLAGDRVVWAVNAAQAGQFTKKPSDFKKQAAPPRPPGHP
jgi:hypothetical protein